MSHPAPQLVQQLGNYRDLLRDYGLCRDVAEARRRLSAVEEELESVVSVVSANLQRAVRRRHSILQRAFAGELV